MANRGADSFDQEGNKKRNEGKGVGNTCAACKHLEKMCTDGECEFAPYFPANRMEDFVAVQRVFKISKVSKMLKGTDPVRGREVAKSLIWEAQCWKNDPVHGPLGYHHSLCDRIIRRSENQISNKDQQIQKLTNKLKLLQQLPLNFDRNVGLMPHHHHVQDDRWPPTLFQENATFQGGYKPPHHHLQDDSWAPKLFQENATFQGGYMPPHHHHHHLQEDSRASMLFQEKATFHDGGHNVASGSTSFPPATAYNQTPAVVVQDLSDHSHQDDQGNIGRNIGDVSLGDNNFLQAIGGSAGAAVMDNIDNNNNRGGICLDKDSNVNVNPSRFGSRQYGSKKLWSDLFP